MLIWSRELEFSIMKVIDRKDIYLEDCMLFCNISKVSLSKLLWYFIKLVVRDLKGR